MAAILTGDLHHYSRYEESLEKDHYSRHLITAGGGGAFTHPTHTLKENIAPTPNGTAHLKATFPSPKQSKSLAFWNLAFPFFSRSMMLFLGTFHLLTTWILQSSHQTLIIGQNNEIERYTFMECASKIPLSFYNFGDFICLIRKSISHSPSILILNLLLMVGIFLFTDTSAIKKGTSRILGLIHSLAHITNLYILIWVFSVINLEMIKWPIYGFKQMALFAFEMVVIGGFLSALIFGIYLLISIVVIGNHPNEAFSSFRWSGCKNFLKIHITKEAITIYPVGIKTVVKDWENIGTEEHPKFKGSDLKYQIIEEPIKIPL